MKPPLVESAPNYASAKESFDAVAQDYERQRPRLVPHFDLFYGTLIERLAFAAGDKPRILDLGAGTGLLSAMVLARFPDAALTLLDISDNMLGKARERFAGRPDITFRIGDLTSDSLGGPFDAIVSGLAIHHLEDGEKQGLYKRVLAALEPGGVFINGDLVLGPSETLEHEYEQRWQANCRAAGASEAELASSIDRQLHDKSAMLDQQLGWLTEDGFSDADCWYKHYRFAVFGGRRPLEQD